MNRCHPLDLTEHLHALFALASFAPDDDEDDDLSPAGDDESHDSDGAAGEGDGEDDDDDEDKPRIKRLSDEAAKHRRLRRAERERAEKAEARVAELEAAATGDVAAENRMLHLRLAFERATTAAKIHDPEAAWDHVQDDLKAMKVEKGQVDSDRMREVVGHVVERYPYLVGDDDQDEPSGDAFPLTASGPIPPARRTQGVGMDNATLAKKFPALRR